MCESGAVVTELVTLNPLHLERMKLLKSDGEAVKLVKSVHMGVETVKLGVYKCG